MGNIEGSDNFLFYTTDEGKQNIQVYVDENGETVWMTQKGMAEVFGVDRSVITKHIGNIYNEGELDKDSTSAKFAQVQNEGGRKVNREVEYYNLDAIISVGYRVNSQNATRFRIWATGILKEYLTKGFAMDDDRLAQGKTLFGKDYFDELLERVRKIRTSERRFYEKVTDLYATSVDYNSKSPITRQFYATVQNKLEYAITKMTAAEIIKSRANSEGQDMGLTTWKRQKAGGEIAKRDVSVAKNYLTETEMSDLNHLVSMYLDYAESQARKSSLMSMRDWSSKLDAFLKFNEYEILVGAGKIKASVAKVFAESEYVVFSKIQDQNYVSDYNNFDQTIDAIILSGVAPTEPSPAGLLKGSVTLSIEEELAKARKKLGLDDRSKDSKFNKSLKTALNYNPKEDK
jgi:hypothetical protein